MQVRCKSYIGRIVLTNTSRLWHCPRTSGKTRGDARGRYLEAEDAAADEDTDATRVKAVCALVPYTVLGQLQSRTRPG